MHIFCLSDCRQVLLVSEILVCIGILLSFHVLFPYSVPQYVGSALLTFVAAEVLEGNSLSRFGTIIASLFSKQNHLFSFWSHTHQILLCLIK